LLEKVPLRLFDGISFPTNRLRLEFEAASERVTLRNLPVKETSDVHTLMLDTKKEYDLVFMGAVSPSRMRFMMQVLALVSEEMSSIKWLFLGIPDATVAWAKSIDTKALLERHAVFVKQVPYPEVQDYLSKSRIGFNHHPLEKRFLVSIPMKIFEYMRAGLPVVSTALPEITELLKNGVQAILINSNNPLQYSRAIMALIRDPGRSQAIGRAAQELIRESLNWETTEYPKLLGLYSKVLNG
jgi:glycosyltransferase involved in cell wall biosynthesis